MLRQLLVLICVVVLCSVAGAETVFERSFQEMGYEDFSAEGALQQACGKIEFIYPSNADAFSEENYTILSINAVFVPAISPAATIDVNFNGLGIAKINGSEFKCNETNCWARAKMPRNAAKENTNRIDICLNTSNTTTKIVLDNNSKIGLYKIADFSEKDSFITTAEPKEIVIGETTKITVILHNKGSDSAQVEIKYARPIAENQAAFAFVGGRAFAKQEIGAGEKIEIEYEIKPRVLENITIPPAAVYYNNVFGEEEMRFSELVTIHVREPDKNIEAFIGKSKEKLMTNETANITISIKNKGRDPLYNLQVAPTMLAGMHAIGASQQGIESILPGETKSVDFQVSANSPGEFEVGCDILFKDLGQTESPCATKLVFAQPQIPPEIIAGLIIAVLGAALYIYIMKS
ncbi:MAG: hypothetical protein JW772_02810 [Candidatus Diapherotrites archaeon]|nr:hypothetical protein [Candidatus Diapherotrites archaeon]